MLKFMKPIKSKRIRDILLILTIAIFAWNTKVYMFPDPPSEEEIAEQNAKADEISAEKDRIVEELKSTLYIGYPSTVVGTGEPFFTQQNREYGETSFESYSELDSLGRVGVAYASLSKDTMPAENEERGEIGMIKPIGWETAKYDCINGKYVYNRCHLIAWCLSAENANEKNLCTGTRYMNVDGMLPYEEEIANYLDENTQNHVLYRVTPVFRDNDLCCAGILLEAYSVEDHGQGVEFCVYCFNVQPGINIDYTTGVTTYTGNFKDTTSSSVIAQ